jgi:hypothetical protein
MVLFTRATLSRTSDNYLFVIKNMKKMPKSIEKKNVCLLVIIFLTQPSSELPYLFSLFSHEDSFFEGEHQNQNPKISHNKNNNNTRNSSEGMAQKN